METLWRDLKYSLRTLLRSRGLTLTAVASLALAIGANTTIFTVIHAVFLKPLPVAEPSRLVAVYRTFQQTPGAEPQIHGTSYLNTRDLREQSTAFAEVTAIEARGSSRYVLSIELGAASESDAVTAVVLRAVLDMGITPRGVAEGSSLEEFFLRVTGSSDEGT